MIINKIILNGFVFLLLQVFIFAQERTVGLMVNELGTYDGYTLIASLSNRQTYLINNDGEKVHEWSSEYRPGAVNYLLEDGSLLRASSPPSDFFSAGGKGGRLEIISWEDQLKWFFDWSSEKYRLHHDVEMMPNGNILAIAWISIDPDSAIANGKDPVSLKDSLGNYQDLWSEMVLEIDTTDNSIVWEWNLFDHIVQDHDSTKSNYGVISDHPELIDINSGYSPGDWLHFNSIDYNEDLDQIILTSYFTSEVYIIDHSTTKEEAASHVGGKYGVGGDFLYRWGYSSVYDREGDRRLYRPHDAHWLETSNSNNKIMIFNNGAGEDFSSVEIFSTPINSLGSYDIYENQSYAPDESEWIYTGAPKESFYAPFVSGAQRLPNGNTLICEGPHGRIFEIDSYFNIVWEYINPVIGNDIITQGDTIPIADTGTQQNLLFRAYKYGVDYGIFKDEPLIPYGPIEIYPDNWVGIHDVDSNIEDFKLSYNYPNPFNSSTTIPYIIPFSSRVEINILDINGKFLTKIVDEYQSDGEKSVIWNGKDNLGRQVSAGVYLYRIKAGEFTQTRKMLFLK